LKTSVYQGYSWYKAIVAYLDQYVDLVGGNGSEVESGVMVHTTWPLPRLRLWIELGAHSTAVDVALPFGNLRVLCLAPSADAGRAFC
jgi:hypothetical protein